MADEGMLTVMPTEGRSAGTDETGPGKISFLSASWINARVLNVAEQAERLLTRLIDDGLLSDGFAPFESPITDEMLRRMTPEQFSAYFDTVPTLEGKSMLLARMKTLKLPPSILMPFERQLAFPQGLAQQPPYTLSSSE